MKYTNDDVAKSHMRRRIPVDDRKPSQIYHTCEEDCDAALVNATVRLTGLDPDLKSDLEVKNPLFGVFLPCSHLNIITESLE